MTAAIANPSNKLAPVRLVMEKVGGVHRKRKLPEFAGRTFQGWAKKRSTQPLDKKGKVALFYTCTVNYNQPEIGRAAVAVLERTALRSSCRPRSVAACQFWITGT